MLHSPFFGSGKLEYYLATRRPVLKVRGVDAFEPVANLRRCYLRQDPVFLRSLLRLAGRKIDRRFYFSRLLPGTQRGRAGRRARLLVRPAAQQLSGKWGSFTQQRPLGLSSVRRMQRPPRNVTVQCQDALGYLRALPSQAPRHCIYADPPYIFPGRSMNYYGTRRRGHDLAFHSELRDALFASGGPGAGLVRAWQSCCGNRIAAILLLYSILSPQQDCPDAAPAAQAWSCSSRAQPCDGAGPAVELQAFMLRRKGRPAPGPNPTSVWRSDFRLRWRKVALRPKPRSRPRSDRSRGAGLAFPSLLRTFRPQRER